MLPMVGWWSHGLERRRRNLLLRLSLSEERERQVSKSCRGMMPAAERDHTDTQAKKAARKRDFWNRFPLYSILLLLLLRAAGKIKGKQSPQSHRVGKGKKVTCTTRTKVTQNVFLPPFLPNLRGEADSGIGILRNKSQ